MGDGRAVRGEADSLAKEASLNSLGIADACERCKEPITPRRSRDLKITSDVSEIRSGD